MSLINTLVILLLNLSVAVQQLFAAQPQVKEIRVANFFPLRGHKLAVSPIASLEFPNEPKCLTSCVKTNECHSVNTKKQANKNVRCELLNYTKNYYPENITKDEGSTHWYDKPPKTKPKPSKSCKEILSKNPKATSGVYEISTDNDTVKVYCEMVLHGGGFTFIPKSAVRSGTLPNLVSQLFTNNNEVLLYIQKKDGSQTYTHIRQLAEESQTPFVVLQNTHSDGSTTYLRPINIAMIDYLYLSTSGYISGFLSNNVAVEYNYGHSYPIKNCFVFLPNHREQKPSTYFNGDLRFEAGGFAVDWRNTGIPSKDKIPGNFFFLTEVHYYYGCYTSSDRWTEATGTAIGLR